MSGGDGAVGDGGEGESEGDDGVTRRRGEAALKDHQRRSRWQNSQYLYLKPFVRQTAANSKP